MNPELERQEELLAEIKSLKKENRLLKMKSKLSDADLNNALEAAKQADSSKSKFLTTMSHEIRTPLNSIIGVSDIELINKKHSKETKDAFSRINNSGKLLLGIINDILDLSKLESGKLEIVPNKYETASLINDIAQFNLLNIGDKQIDFIVKVPETLPSVLYGDELRIRQVLNNMLSNAVKYTQQGSVTFEVDAKPRDYGHALIFRVKDTGQGMSREQLVALHEKNSIFNHGENRTAEGAGLGMSISIKVVEMMDGMIDVESEPGGGSLFTIYLPQQRVEGNDTTIGKEIAESLQSLKFTGTAKAKLERDYMPYGKVLIVDDMNTNLFVAQGLMKPYGLEIETALSGFEALDKVRGGSTYDVVFMDHMMPEMDGMETTKQLRKVGYQHPVVALTANAMVGQAEEFIKNGFDDFMAKPIDIMQLNDILNKLVRDKQSDEVLEDAKKQKEKLDNEEATEVSEDSEDTESTDPLELLRRIDELDVDSAIEAMSGMPDLYVETVKLTLRLLSERIQKMDAFIDSDIKAFTIEVHGLKSSMRNIGATALGNNAASLERAAKEDDIPYCKENYPDFKAGLISLEERLKMAIPEEEDQRETADVSALLPALGEAKTAAEEYDRDGALEIINKHAAFAYDEETDEELKQIVFALEAFDCEDAMEKMEKLEERLK